LFVKFLIFYLLKKKKKKEKRKKKKGRNRITNKDVSHSFARSPSHFRWRKEGRKLFSPQKQKS